MNDPSSSNEDDFQQELNALRSILGENLKRAKQDPLLGIQVEFWLESARFMEKNIEIWEDVRNAHKTNEARERMRRVLDVLQDLIDQINKGSGE